MRALPVARRFQEFVLAHVKDPLNWCIPKFFNMRKYEEAIFILGNVEYLSSAPGERTNAEFKAHEDHTNRHADMIYQVRTWASSVRAGPICSLYCATVTSVDVEC